MVSEEHTGPGASFSLGRLLASTAILAVLAGGIWIYLYGVPEPGGGEQAAATTGTGDTTPAPAASPEAPPAVPVAVETAFARLGNLVMKITATGTAEAARQLVVTSTGSGLVERLEVREGDVVEQGALLVALDTADLELDRQRVRERFVQATAKFSEKQIFLAEPDEAASDVVSELAEAQQQLFAGVISGARFRSLIDDPRFDALFASITRDEVMAAQDNLMATRADYAAAELALERATIEAPFGGQIAELKVVEGSRVATGTELLTLTDADPIRVRVEVLESEAGLVRRGREARVRFAAYPRDTFTGRIETISPLVDPEKKTLEVIVTLPNPQLRLKPGMFAQISLDTEIFQDRLLVPSSAVLLRDDRPMLFVVRDGRSEWVYIQKGLENAETVEVLEGVQAGDEVVVSGHYSLAHNAAVRVVDPEAGPEGDSDGGDGPR